MFKSKDTVLNFVYSIGAAVVIMGAFFKMTHVNIPGLSANFVLGLGLIVEALIFVVYAFNPPKEDYAWENVYPELSDESTPKKPRPSSVTQVTHEVKELEISLSQKLDQMLAEAKLDSSLFERLKTGIDKFSASVSEINQTVDVSQATQKYNDQLNVAANHLESMNALYSLQLENGRVQNEFSKKYVEDMQKAVSQSEKFNDELTGLTNNLNNLNRVYGSMLSAMKS